MSLRDRPWYPVLYMFVVTAFFSTILIGFSRLTRDRVEVNQQVAFERAVLQVLPLDLPDKISPPEVHRLFVERIAAPTAESGGAYLLMQDGKPAAFALPVQGQGFWDMIRGVVGIGADRQTITGISFYEQNETPGLGAEIVQPPFRSQFPGKSIARTGKPLRILPVGTRLGPSDVHAVTGATQTSTRLERFLEEALTRWRAEEERSE